MRRWALRNRIRDLLGLPPLPPPGSAEAVPSPPRVEVGLAGAVPGLVVRLVPGVVAVVAALLTSATGYGWFVTAVAAVTLIWKPRGPAAAVFTCLIGLSLIGSGDLLAVDPLTGTVPGVWRMAGLVLAVHLLLVSSALAGHVAWRSFVEVGVLTRAAGAVLGTQAVAQSLVLLVAWLRAWQPAGQEWLRAVAVVAVIGVAVLVIPREWLARRARRYDG
jgi:hypothetical protein